MLSSYRLPLSFAAERLHADLEQIQPSEWVAHFNKRDYDGAWHGVPLRAVAGNAASISANPNSQGKYRDTDILARCPYLQEVLAQFQCPLNSVRLLRLGAGAVIREHRDHQLGFAEGEVRIHIPITTNPDVVFVVNGRRLVMNAGECWYIDFSLPHRVANRGSNDRIHLVLDCTVNDWLRALLPAEITAPVPEPAPQPTFGEEPSSPEALQRFRQLVWDDPVLQEELRDTCDPELFVATVVRLGAERGCLIAAGDIKEAMQAGAAGMAPKVDRMTEAQKLAGWVPLRVYPEQDRAMVDWFYLGTRRFTGPFFEDTAAACLENPFNLVFRRQTPIEALAEWQMLAPGLKPAGFVFHMSRCGSTLIARMLAALDRNVVLSEAGPIDDVLSTHLGADGVTAEQRCAWLRGMVSALGQARRGGETHLFIKFDCWHTLHLPLIRQAFPGVPWLFLYRDPVEVLVSHQKRPGVHTVPGLMDPAWLLGLPAAVAAQMPREEYSARVLARISEAAWQEYGQGGGLLVNYDELPGVVPSTIAEHFGLALKEADRASMQTAARVNAREPYFEFTDDRAEKQRTATALVRRMADTWVTPVYERLEEARLAQPKLSAGRPAR